VCQEDTRGVDLVARRLALVATVALLATHAYSSYRLRGETEGLDKALALTRASGATVRLFYFSAAALLVSTIAFLVTEAYVQRGRISWVALGVIAVYAALCVLNGERDVALVLFAWVASNSPYWTRRFILGSVAATGLLVLLVPLTREVGLTTNKQAEVIRGLSGEDMVRSALTQASANLLIFTQVAALIPEDEAYRLGGTYLDSLATFIPGESKAKERALNSWFVEMYTPGGTSGYGFAMDAEAYMNFGWAGPPVVFLLWGLLLGVLYRRARQRRCSTAAEFLCVLVLAVSIFAIRADSRMLLKMVVYGFVSMAALWGCAALLSRGILVARELTRSGNGTSGYSSNADAWDTDGSGA